MSTDKELENVRRDFNAALARLNKLDWRDRITRKLHDKIAVLGETEAIELLREIETKL